MDDLYSARAEVRTSSSMLTVRAVPAIQVFCSHRNPAPPYSCGSNSQRMCSLKALRLLHLSKLNPRPPSQSLLSLQLRAVLPSTPNVQNVQSSVSGMQSTALRQKLETLHKHFSLLEQEKAAAEVQTRPGPRCDHQALPWHSEGSATHSQGIVGPVIMREGIQQSHMVKRAGRQTVCLNVEQQAIRQNLNVACDACP